MAKIKNIQLKSVKTFIGEDGVGFNANIYINNKKIGFAIDTANGAPIDIRFHNPQARIEFGRSVKEYYKENPATVDGEDMFIAELIELVDLEKTFKKNVKEGYPILVSIRYRPRFENINERANRPIKRSQLVGVVNEITLEEVIQENKPVEHTVYRSLEDFVVA